MKPDVRVFADGNELSLRAAEAVVGIINQATQANGRCSLALSGGNTPRTLHRLLASRFRDQVPWAKVHLFWGDERYVPPDDPQSNYRMARETLLEAVPIPAENVHPMPTGLPDPDAAAREYEKTLRSYFSQAANRSSGNRDPGNQNDDWPRFDLVLLGLGEEGHTASLFPGSPALEETRRWVVAVKPPAAPSPRLTLTLPAITEAASIFFLVTGADKAQALHHVLTGPPDAREYPASGVRPAQGTVVWWVDNAAAALLGEPAA